MADTQKSISEQSGRVWAHVGQPFGQRQDEREFDIVVVGAGRMGAACALYLRQLAPYLSLLLTEEGGLPNEEGATILAPGVWSAQSVPPEHQQQAYWTRQQLAGRLGEISFEPRSLIQLGETGEVFTHTAPTRTALADHPEALALIDPDLLPLARVDTDAATYRPGSVALNAAQQAIKLGANLMLNARATPTSGGVRLERLTVTNTHQIVTHETVEVRSRWLVVAAGASGPHLLEHSLGRHTAHGRAFVQYPRLEASSTPQTPVLRAGPLMLRPQHGGWTLCPAPRFADPHGYAPTAGHLTGVPTGLRRETLEDFVALMPAVPALAGEGLGVGRSLSDVAGAWVSLPGGRVDGLPVAQNLGDGVFLLLGGLHADTLGLSTAYQLAQTIAQQAAELFSAG